MAIDEPQSDTQRAIQHDPDQTWPASVVLQVTWVVEGAYRVRTSIVSADQFFGRGQFGAPISGDALVSAIEHMRRAGPPPAARITRRAENKSRAKRRVKSRNVANRKGAALRVKREGSS